MVQDGSAFRFAWLRRDVVGAGTGADHENTSQILQRRHREHITPPLRHRLCRHRRGGFALGLTAFSPRDVGTRGLATVAPGNSEVTAWVVVKPDDTCIVRIARSEMGQGTRTGLAQLVTEELECDWAKVSTGDSRGIRISEDYVRRGAAAARIMLLQAAGEA